MEVCSRSRPYLLVLLITAQLVTGQLSVTPALLVCNTSLHYTVILHCTAILNCNLMQRCAATHTGLQYCTALYCSVAMHFKATLYCTLIYLVTALYCFATLLHYTALHCTVRQGAAVPAPLCSRLHLADSVLTARSLPGNAVNPASMC